MTPDGARRWYDALVPMANQGGPVLTLVMTLALVFSMWWLGGWVRECVEHNRSLAQQLVTQQQAFHTELRLFLTQCQGAGQGR